MFSVAIRNFHSDHFFKIWISGIKISCPLGFTLQSLPTLDTGLNHIYIYIYNALTCVGVSQNIDRTDEFSSHTAVEA